MFSWKSFSTVAKRNTDGWLIKYTNTNSRHASIPKFWIYVFSIHFSKSIRSSIQYYQLNSIFTKYRATLLPKIPTITLIRKQSSTSTLKQEDSHNIRHISDFHFPLTYKGISYASCCLYMYGVWFIPSTNKIFVSKKRYFVPTKNIAKLQTIDRVYHTKSLK